MELNRWIFLKDGKPTFLQPPPSQTGWVIDISAAQLVWKTAKEPSFKYLRAGNLNQDSLENTFGDYI
jgi:hypothetical protein